MEKEVQRIVKRIFDLYDAYGDQEYGERVNMMMHMMQCAQIAQEEGENDEIILAAFFHDIGHFLGHKEQMDGYGTQNHDQLGGRFLMEMGFPQKISRLVSHHVLAKRYLTYAEPGYYDTLSEASRKTLEFQGGKMTAEEAEEFENDPLSPLYIKIRRWDDLGKDPRKAVKPIDIQQMKDRVYRYLLRILLQKSE